MSASIAMGDAKVASCQPVADSPENVTLPRFAPAVDHSVPVWVPVFAGGLVEPDAGDEAGDVGPELDAELDGAGDRSPRTPVVDGAKIEHGQTLLPRP